MNTVLDNAILILIRCISKSNKETNTIFIGTQVKECLKTLRNLQAESTDMVVIKLPCHVHMSLVLKIKVYQNRLRRIGS